MYQYALTLLDAVRALPPDRFEPVVLACHADWQAERLSDEPCEWHVGSFSALDVKLPQILRLLPLPGGIARNLCGALLPLASQMRELRVDLWCYPTQDHWAYQLPFPALGTIHDLMHLYEGQFPEVGSVREFRSRQARFRGIVRQARGILVDSEVGKQQVRESYPEAKAERIHPLPYIPPRYMTNPSGGAGTIRTKYDLPERYLFYPAQFWEHKNHLRLVRAVHTARAGAAPDLQLVLAGSQRNGYAAVQALVDELDLREAIHFIGYVENDDLPDLYRQAVALVMPTFFGPTNIPPLEAMAVACPVAISGTYGMPEQSGDGALYFEPTSEEEITDVITRLWTDDNLCAALSANGRKRRAEWTAADFASRFADIITSIVSPQPRA